jgi:hypothetical protein
MQVVKTHFRRRRPKLGLPIKKKPTTKRRVVKMKPRIEIVYLILALLRISASERSSEFSQKMSRGIKSMTLLE